MERRIENFIFGHQVLHLNMLALLVSKWAIAAEHRSVDDGARCFSPKVRLLVSWPPAWLVGSMAGDRPILITNSIEVT
jgi:hypothetical protein